MDIITIQAGGRCFYCKKCLSKGAEAILENGEIFCFADRAVCHEEYIEKEHAALDLELNNYKT